MKWLYDQIWIRILTIGVGILIILVGIVSPNNAWELFRFRCIYGGGCRKPSRRNNLAIVKYMKSMISLDNKSE